MSRFIKLTWLLMALVLPGLVSCGGGTPTSDPALAFTQAWQTVEVAQTQTALSVPPTPSSTSTPEALPTQQATNTPLITSTPLPGTPSATPYSIPTLKTFQSTACDNADFVSDVTIPDGAFVEAGAPFVKTWRFKNKGPCTWTTGYHLVFSYASDTGKGVFSPPGPVNFPQSVLPGETVDISVTIMAPTKAEGYQAWFVLQNEKGYTIPLLNMNSYEFWVAFLVK